MADALPLEILMAEFLSDGWHERIEEQVKKVKLVPSAKKLRAFTTRKQEDNPNELIEHRFLYRGGVCLLLGPTGIGKSSLLMQLAINFSVGKPLFGITPGSTYRKTGMNILLVQAENDDDDLTEMRDGVFAGCELNEEDADRALDQITVSTINDKSSDGFALALDGLLDEYGPFDLVMIDPAFAYLGGDSNSQKEVSHFMRELLNPLLQRYKVGLILAHHTNKPLRGKEKDNWAAGDYAYLGAGSAEWINPARAALALRSIGSDTVFELRAPKRGKRLGWKDDNDQSTVTQLIAHHREQGVICWRVAEASEVEEMASEDKDAGRRRSCDLTEILHCIEANPNENQGFYKELASEAMGCSQQAVQRAIQHCLQEGWVRFKEQGRNRLYRITKKGQKKASERPNAHDWKNE
ncbi:MAG: AAA family ATPase [Verrucomicrobiota bacterium]